MLWMTKASLAFLRRIHLFKGLPQNNIEDLAQIAIEKSFQKGETLFSEGDEGNGFYVVMEGQVKVFKLSSEGREQILHIFGPGEPFGEVPVFAGESFPANARALSDSHLLFFPRTGFTDLITQHPSLALNMLAVLSMRLRQFTVQVEHLSLKEVQGRLAAYVLSLSDDKDGDHAVDLNISKGQLASLLGTIPETLSRILARMTRQGLIQMNGRRIQILDRVALEELAMVGKNSS